MTQPMNCPGTVRSHVWLYKPLPDGDPAVRVEHGNGPAGLPFHRFGTGDERLVIVPGVMDSLGWNTPGALTAHLLARYYFHRLREFDVWVLSRPPGLLAGITAEKMAEQYADALDELGPAHILGFSLGGAIGSHVAANRPDLVDRLILAGAAHRLGSYGETIMARWQELAERQEWASLHVDYSQTVYAGSRRIIIPPLYRLGARLLPEPESRGDVSSFHQSSPVSRRTNGATRRRGTDARARRA